MALVLFLSFHTLIDFQVNHVYIIWPMKNKKKPPTIVCKHSFIMTLAYTHTLNASKIANDFNFRFDILFSNQLCFVARFRCFSLFLLHQFVRRHLVNTHAHDQVRWTILGKWSADQKIYSTKMMREQERERERENFYGFQHLQVKLTKQMICKSFWWNVNISRAQFSCIQQRAHTQSAYKTPIGFYFIAYT